MKATKEPNIEHERNKINFQIVWDEEFSAQCSLLGEISASALHSLVANSE